MRTPVDARLRREAETFALRFACEDCVHFDPERARCAHGYPAAPRRAALEGEAVEFCKDFDLGSGDLPPDGSRAP